MIPPHARTGKSGPECREHGRRGRACPVPLPRQTGALDTGDRKGRAGDHKGRPYIAYAVFGLATAGCGDTDLSDLERLVEDAAKSSAAAPSIPTARGGSGFEYGAMAERSPFEPFAEVARAGASPAPDPARSPQPQERFPLGQLEMVGTLAGRGKTLALIRDPSGITHPLAVGDYLGRDHGRITAIRPSGIDILELVEDGEGGWTARARALDLNIPRDPEDGSAKTDEGGNEE